MPPVRCDHEVPLSELEVGASAMVRQVAPGPTGGRLGDLGILPGTRVEVVRRAPLGDPLVLELRGYQLCLRRRDAALVIVAPGHESGER